MFEFFLNDKFSLYKKRFSLTLKNELKVIFVRKKKRTKCFFFIFFQAYIRNALNEKKNIR